jgi:IS605 OrfB family transposase
MRYDGTVAKRFFINQSVEKDQQKHYLNRLKLKQIQGGKYAKNSKLWNKINNINDFIVNDTANQIIKLAVINNVDVIVLEYLEFQGKKLSNKAQQLHYWAIKKLQTKIEEKAHRVGIRLNRVNAKNTSKLAFDGSGKVNRDITNFSNCTFTTGKQYNCDLNASYNIGARYFIKEINKAISVKKWSDVVAKVPQLQRRTQCTLSTLISLVAVL